MLSAFLRLWHREVVGATVSETEPSEPCKLSNVSIHSWLTQRLKTTWRRAVLDDMSISHWGHLVVTGWGTLGAGLSSLSWFPWACWRWEMEGSSMAVSLDKDARWPMGNNLRWKSGTILARAKIFCREKLVAHQTIETMFPKELKFSQGDYARGRKRLKAASRWASLLEVSHNSDKLSCLVRPPWRRDWSWHNGSSLTRSA